MKAEKGKYQVCHRAKKIQASCNSWVENATNEVKTKTSSK